ncbi:haloacid dehalogenase-like hydrolase [Otariodibacter oris]|uniref:Phosphatidylglycerophosphatase C n=1 Tax=Otariodibacter oris TaxID=1032623 RepID=A0A420XEI9_9PAST|nr:haloacid dehalogenase-like hydrolase [Otariodibacter oris]RKR70743.1 phosphatidylglycerophosphatase C [Otariodibacter oris]
MKYIFFDIDGTLHKEDAFKAFIRYLIGKRWGNLVIFFPFILVGFLLHKMLPTGKFGINLVFFFLGIGSSLQKRGEYAEEFSSTFTYHPFPDVVAKFSEYLNKGYHVVLISGSPKILIQHIYKEWLEHDNVTLIASELSLADFKLHSRCMAHHKLEMLDEHFQRAIYFEAGYSDSLSDLPVLTRCKFSFKVTEQGKIEPISIL